MDALELLQVQLAVFSHRQTHQLSTLNAPDHQLQSSFVWAFSLSSKSHFVVWCWGYRTMKAGLSYLHLSLSASLGQKRKSSFSFFSLLCPASTLWQEIVEEFWEGSTLCKGYWKILHYVRNSVILVSPCLSMWGPKYNFWLRIADDKMLLSIPKYSPYCRWMSNSSY